MKTDVSAVILAGGKGRRMGGRNKALLEWGGETLLARQIRICATWADEIIVVSRDAEVERIASRFPPVRVVPDPAGYEGEGPLAGFAAGASCASGAFVWLVACDMPHISAEAASLLLQRLRESGAGAPDAAPHAALPKLEGRLQPLHGIYCRQAALEAAKLLLRQGRRKMTDLLGHLSYVCLDADEFARCGIVQAFTADVDTPEDYRNLKNAPNA